MSKNMDVNFNWVQSTWGVACTFNNKWNFFYLYQFEHMPVFGINENM